MDAGPAVFKTVCGFCESKHLTRVRTNGRARPLYMWGQADAVDKCSLSVAWPRARSLICVDKAPVAPYRSRSGAPSLSAA